VYYYDFIVTSQREKTKPDNGIYEIMINCMVNDGIFNKYVIIYWKRREDI